MHFYRELRAPGLEDSTYTEEFTQIMNDLFDALNTKLPFQGVTLESNHFKVSYLKNIFAGISAFSCNKNKSNIVCADNCGILRQTSSDQHRNIKNKKRQEHLVRQ